VIGKSIFEKPGLANLLLEQILPDEPGAASVKELKEDISIELPWADGVEIR